MLVFSALTGACGSTDFVPDDTRTLQSYCPRSMKVECFERMGQPKRCRCVTDAEMERTIEDLTNFGIN